MYQLDFKIKTLAPVIISLKYGEINTVNTERYIPGTTVLGMLAWRYWNLSDQDKREANFRNLFLDGSVRFTNGWLTQKNEYEEDIAYYPPPVSFRKNKVNEDDIYNMLFAGEDFDEQTRPVESFISREENKMTQPALELHHHHKRDPNMGSPAEGQLFTYEALSPGQVFHGYLFGEEGDLKQLIDTCKKNWIAWIGRSRNSQYGKIDFAFGDIEPDNVDFPSNSKNQVVLTMRSHTLIYSECGFPSTCKHDLERYLYKAEIKRAAIKSRYLENFVGKWGFQKPSEFAFHAGSSFLLDIQQADREALANLQTTGLGERRHEGFGQVNFEKPDETFKAFHIDEYSAESEPERPAVVLPECARSIVTEIINTEIRNQVGIMAAEALQEFNDEKLESVKGSLVSRIEGFLKSGKTDMEQFRKDINDLKSIAMNQLERCRNKNDTMTLKSFFIKKQKALEIDTLLNQQHMENVRLLCEEIGYQHEFNDNALEYLYFEAFLSLMKKRIKLLQKED